MASFRYSWLCVCGCVGLLYITAAYPKRQAVCLYPIMCHNNCICSIVHDEKLIVQAIASHLSRTFWVTAYCVALCYVDALQQCYFSNYNGPSYLAVAITPFKIIQGHRFCYRSKAHMRLPITD